MAVLPDSLLHHPTIWRAESHLRQRRQVVSSGCAALDAHLPGGGWPLPGLIEVLYEQEGIGEFNLFVPALARLNAELPTPQAAVLAWINPPFIPYAPALQAWQLSPIQQFIVTARESDERLWAMEQCLRSGACYAVLGWADQMSMQWLRRLKLAASDSGGLGILYRPLKWRMQPSAATIRMALSAEGAKRHIQLLKVQGGRPGIVPWP